MTIRPDIRVGNIQTELEVLSITDALLYDELAFRYVLISQLPDSQCLTILSLEILDFPLLNKS